MAGRQYPRPPWSQKYPYSLLSDEEEKYVRFCAFNQATVEWTVARDVTLLEDYVDLDDYVVFGSNNGKNTPRNAALQLFRESYSRIVGRARNKLLQFPLSPTYTVFDLIEETEETLALFARADRYTSYESATTNGSRSPSRPQHHPTANSVSPRPRSQSQASSLTPPRPQRHQQLASPPRPSETPSTAAAAPSRIMSEENPYIHLNVSTHNVRGILFIPVTQIKVKKGSGQKLIDCFTFIMPIEDASYLRCEQPIFEAWMHEDNGGFTLTVPSRNAFDIQNMEMIAQRASKDFPGQKGDDLKNQILLSFEKHSAPSYASGQKKQVGLPAKPSQEETAVEVPLEELQFRFPTDFTCRPVDFNKDDIDENGQDLKVTIFPVTNYPQLTPMLDRFKANYVIAEGELQGTTSDPKAIASLAFSKTYVEEVIEKCLRASCYLKITMQKESIEDNSFGDNNKTPNRNAFNLSDMFDSLPTST